MPNKSNTYPKQNCSKVHFNTTLPSMSRFTQVFSSVTSDVTVLRKCGEQQKRSNRQHNYLAAIWKLRELNVVSW